MRNLLNFRNVLQVFAVNGDVRNDAERAAHLDADLDDLASERDANDAVGANGAIVLPTAHENCAGWVSSRNDPAAANCMYLIRAEQRYGEGDHVFTIDEQTNAINPLYDVGRGEQQQVGVGPRARLGFEVNFSGGARRVVPTKNAGSYQLAAIRLRPIALLAGGCQFARRGWRGASRTPPTQRRGAWWLSRVPPRSFTSSAPFESVLKATT